MFIIYGILILSCTSFSVGEFCPKQCDCDMEDGLNRATCVNQNIISIDIGVPKAVQVYSLSQNIISELNNFCFKESGYSSIEILNLSFNLIFWIGLHAFAGLDKLTYVDISNNRLRYIPSDLFWDTPNLNTLDLSGNVFEELKNEPFLMHSNIRILNLNNCRIKTLPDRLFTRLPNLRKLDISENYMISLSTEVLRPLKKLERLELKNDYLHCDRDLIATEAWIVSRQITYKKQCIKKQPKMSEKMISMVPIEKKSVDVEKVWNITTKNVPLPKNEAPTRAMTPFEKFDSDFPAFQSFIIGLEIGLGIGIVGTYIWLRKFCTCGQLNCVTPETRRHRRRMQRINAEDSSMRTSLLWNSVLNPDLETPPTLRRELSLPDRAPPFPYGLPPALNSAVQADAVRLPSRSESPPPPYNECRLNV